MLLTDGVVVLRPVTMDDVDDWLAGEDAEQIRWFEAPGPAPRENVVAAVERWTAGWAEDGDVRHLAVTDAETGALAGGVELRALSPGLANLSYLVFPPFRRRGLAVRACRLLVTWGRDHLGLRSVEITVLEGNAASVAVAERLGAVPAGTRPSDAGGTFLVYDLDLS